MRTTRRLAAALAAIVLAAAFAAGPARAASEGVKLDDIGTDVTDVASLQSGARTFVNFCLNCHSASLMRYNALRDIGLTEEQIKDNLMFTAEKIGMPMAIAMSPRDAKDWFGATPPDLSVIARSRGPDWLYTYLRSFYRDPATADGVEQPRLPERRHAARRCGGSRASASRGRRRSAGMAGRSSARTASR